ncbi:MAG: glycosyltransferase [Alphaproteobacteria bacterium]|nr:glycosyltransferase [Alphaproteobacteria bacterium]
MPDIVTVTNAAGEQQTTAEIIIRKTLSDTPKISVIIPVCNVEAYLPQCLKSVISQTLTEIEIICVDDGSTDNSLAILKEYAAKDHRITVISQKNQGAGIARNTGLTVAKGQYLSFLDSDDFFEPDMLATLYTTAKKDNSDAVVCGYYIFDHTKNTDIKKIAVYPPYTQNSPIFPQQHQNTIYHINPAPWNKLFKSSLFKQNNIRFENLKSCNDYTAIYTALMLANKISALNSFLLHYRTNSNSNITATRNQNATCLLHAVQRLWLNLGNHQLQYVYEKSIQESLLSCTQYEMSLCSPEEQENYNQAAKTILPPKLYNFFASARQNPHKTTRRYYLFGFIPFLKITER